MTHPDVEQALEQVREAVFGLIDVHVRVGLTDRRHAVCTLLLLNGYMEHIVADLGSEPGDFARMVMERTRD